MSCTPLAQRLVFIITVLLLAACGNTQPLQFSGRTMGTGYQVQISRFPERLDPDAIAQKLDARLVEINAQMSTYQQDSELSRFNRQQTTDWFPVSPQLAQVVAKAQEISDYSDGAFDVSVGPLVNLWGFGPSPHLDAAPAAEAIQAAQAAIGYQHLQVRQEPPALRKQRPALYVDLSAIAKGYAVDVLAEYLQGLGIKNYLVEIGGEVRVRGSNPQGQPWRIAVERPSAGTRAVQRVVRLNGQAVATSGDYRNYFEQDGQRYSHTIDPRNGYPIKHRLVSVSVIHPDCMSADGLATALMVLGPQAGQDLAVKLGLAALFIVKTDDGFSEHYTPAFMAYLEQ